MAMTQARSEFVAAPSWQRAECKPYLKWIGGKKWAVPALSPLIEAHLHTHPHARYIEPFLGGGAIALDLGAPRMLLADFCKPLVATYQTIKRSPDAVAWALRTLVDRGVDKEAYLRVRSEQTASVVFSAARFIYLNKFGFNGLYRENSKGVFNVPHGGDRSPDCIPSVEHLQQVAQTLKTTEILHSDFRAIIARARAGDFIYCDPPYLDTFSDYVADGFTVDAHTALAQELFDAVERGATILLSNSDCEAIRELYAWTNVEPIAERHSVGATGARRGMKPAIFASNDRELLGTLLASL